MTADSGILNAEHELTGKFRCLRCGNCCRHEGEVRLADGEAEAIAAALNITVDQFTNQYTKLRDDRCGLSLLDSPDGRSCIFLRESPIGCAIHEAKPRQCRNFPFMWKYEDWTQVCTGAQALLNSKPS